MNSAAEEIRRRVAEWVKAIRARNLSAVLSFYAAELVSFDLEPPLRYTGLENKERAWSEFFRVHEGDIGYEVTDLNVCAQGDVAFVRSLNQVSGMLPSGHRSEMWVRWTACLRRVEGMWMVVHDHISVPVELHHGRAALSLRP